MTDMKYYKDDRYEPPLLWRKSDDGWSWLMRHNVWTTFKKEENGWRSCVSKLKEITKAEAFLELL